MSVDTDCSPGVEVDAEIFSSCTWLETERVAAEVDTWILGFWRGLIWWSCDRMTGKDGPGLTTFFVLMFDLEGMMNFSLKERR